MHQMTYMLLNSIGMLAVQEQNMDKYRLIVDKLGVLAELFDMGEYYKVSGRLELAVREKDAEAAITTMQQLLSSIGDINHFTKSPLFEHMAFSETREEFVAQLREDLLKSFKDETYGFLKGDSRWEELK